jgi:hypothetical protein
MEFNYSCHTKSAKEVKLQRIFEILPGLISWLLIVGICILSIYKPLTASVIMIAFLLYWLLRLLYMNIFLIASYIRLYLEKHVDWNGRVKCIDRFFYENDEKAIKSLPFHDRRVIKQLSVNGCHPPPSSDIYHVIIYPVIRQTAGVVQPGIEAIKNSQYPNKKMIIVIAIEAVAPEAIKNEMISLSQKYANDFLKFLTVIHPSDTPGEAKVKGANTTYAARQTARLLQKLQIDPVNVLVSCFDSDTIPEFNYFSCLTYNFMLTKERTRSSFQPVPVYHNNIWEAPAFARIIDIGTSFFQLIEATNPHKLVTFSSHSMSFKALVEVDYWPVDMISDDSAIFWKAFIRFDGNYHVVPIYTTVSMDIAVGRSWKETLKNIYKQKRRWAWGVENFPVVMRGFLQSKKISLYKKVSYGYKLFDTFISWATWSFILLFGSWLPVFFVNKEFASSTVYYTAPRIKTTIYTMAFTGIIVCMIISLLLLPAKRTRHNLFAKFIHTLEWLTIPAIILILSAVPALDSQTRLLFGKYMEFWVSDKQRGGSDEEL